ncbi:MAG: hypothetical protein HIU88_12675 [Acidobacteria bacterium]|nr:hypothetical protein [Acidobacteriota bacterium]
MSNKTTSINQIPESRLLLPDETYAAVYRARQSADAEHAAILDTVLQAWLAAIPNGIGSILDDRRSGAPFTEFVSFLTPECDLIVVGTRNAAAVAARYAQVHGLAVGVRDGMWRVEMVAFGMEN